MKLEETEETAEQAHVLGRHISEHPEDKAFWVKTCKACEIEARLVELRPYNGTVPGARAVAKARAELEAVLRG